MGSIHSLTPVTTAGSEHILFGHQLVVQSGGEMLPPSQSGQRIDPVPAVFEKVKSLLAVLETAPLSEQLSGRSRQLLLSAGSLHRQITSASES